MSLDVVITARNLSKTFSINRSWRRLFAHRTRTALDNVSFEVRRGELVGILGPNGAGKTTIQKILATLVLPTSGNAYVDGFDVVRDSTEVRRRIGLVYGDERSFYWRLSLRENLRFYAALYGQSGNEARAKIEDLIDVVGLSGAADLRMHYYSMGMRQRAAIARGLLGDPKVIFMDEPTRALDPVGTHEVHTIIRQRLMGDGHHTILLATNNMAEAETLCDRVMMINQGTVQWMGSIHEIQASLNPGSRFIIETSRDAERLLASISAIPGVLAVDSAPFNLDHLLVTIRALPGARTVPEVLRFLSTNGVDVWRCEESAARLDELFRLAVLSARPEPGGVPVR